MRPVLLDTGVIVALLDRSERHHARCAAALRELQRPLLTCEGVIAESCYLLRQLPGAPEAVLENVERGVFQLPWQLAPAGAAIRALLRNYRDLPADFADACLIAMADQFGTGDILTLDPHFATYRWGRSRHFSPIPARLD